MKNFVFLADGFEEVEALATIDVMRRAEMDVTTVSISADLVVTGAHGVKVCADALLQDVDSADADWLILPGGMPGATNLVNCEPLCAWLQRHHAAGGHVAAICASPSVVLAPLGILDGKKATCYPGMEQDGFGAEWVPEMAVTDGNVVTGRGPAAALDFGLAIVSCALGMESALDVATGMLKV